MSKTFMNKMENDVEGGDDDNSISGDICTSDFLEIMMQKKIDDSVKNIYSQEIFVIPRSNRQPHYSVLPVFKGFKLIIDAIQTSRALQRGLEVRAKMQRS